MRTCNSLLTNGLQMASPNLRQSRSAGFGVHNDRNLHWTWITNIPLNARSVEPVMRAGRARWKIENETFNTLKNQGYNFEHNYGHGQQNLATNLALLMFLAFTVDQMIQRCWRVFRQVRGGLRTKVKLWDIMRSLFMVQLFPTMDALYRQIADSYDIQLC